MGVSSTRLDSRSFTRNLYASMPYLRFHNCSVLQITLERSVPVPLPDTRSRFCYVLGLCRYWSNENLAARFYNHRPGAERLPTLRIS